MKRKIIFRLSLQIVSLSLLCSCQQELLQTEEEYSQKSQQSTIQQLLRNQLEQKDPQLVSKVDRLQVKKSSGNARIYTDSENGFSVDTEKTVYVEDANGNKTYTFKIERSNPNSGFLENLILKQTGSSEYAAYIVKYDQMAVENLGSIAQNDLKNHITFTPLGTKTGAEVFGKYNANSNCNVMMPYASNWVYVGGTMCYENAHDYAHIGDCIYKNDPAKAPTQGYATYEVSYGPVDICGSGGSSGGVGTMSTGGGTTPMGGGGSSGSTFTDDCTKVKSVNTTIPILPSINAALKDAIADTKENAITAYADYPQNPTFQYTAGTPGGVEIPKNPPKKYIYVGHTHNSPSSSTYSVPSWADLEWIRETYKNEKIDSNTVFVLITADGTQYAMTISDWTKFTNAVYIPVNPTDPNEIILAGLSSAIGIKYYGEKVTSGVTSNTGLIKENSTDKEQDLVYFLKMNKQYDMGINVFEMNNDFTKFTRVTLKNNNIQVNRTPCN